MRGMDPLRLIQINKHFLSPCYVSNIVLSSRLRHSPWSSGTSGPVGEASKANKYIINFRWQNYKVIFPPTENTKQGGGIKRNRESSCYGMVG